MKKENSLSAFDSMPVKKAVLKNAVPAIIAMLMVLVYNLADTFFIGLTHDDLQVAAVSLATPVFLIFMALGTIFGIGGTSVISRAMGEGQNDYAKKVSAFCMWSCVAVGLSVSGLFYIFMDDILTLVGASADTWDFTKDYLNIVILSGPFVLISNCYSNIIRAEGQPTKSMMGMLIGNLLNVVLDPIMILGFGWNIKGAAIATVIGNVVGVVYYLYYYISGKSMLSIHIKDFTVKDKVCSRVLSIGIPASVGVLLMSVSQIIMNSLMSDYGDMAIAAAGVAMKVTMIIGMVSMGLGQGVQPLLGYCVGSKNWKRFKEILRFSILFSGVLGITLTGICYLFANNIVDVFLTQADAFNYGVQFTGILLSSAFLFGIFYCLINALQAIGEAMPSLIVNISRQGLIYIPALFIFKETHGVQGLIWAQPVADVLSLALIVAFCVYSFRRLEHKGSDTANTPSKVIENSAKGIGAKMNAINFTSEEFEKEIN